MSKVLRVVVTLFVAVLAAGFGATSAAAADSNSYAVVSGDVSFDSAAADSFAVSVLNLTATAASVTVNPSGASSTCTGAASPGTVAAHGVTKVKVELHGCVVPDKGGYGVTLLVGGEALDLSVGPATAPATPDWNLFYAFPIAIAATMLVLLVAVRDTHKPKTEEGGGGGEGLGTKKWWQEHPLLLSPGWSLKDSWASNVTAISAAFAAVFGTDTVLKSILGTDTDPLFALAAVASAISVALIGAAPLVLSVLRHEGKVTPRGLFLGAALTVGATGGQLAVLTLGSRNLKLGGVQNYVCWGGLIGGGLLLVVYTYQTMFDSLRPPPPKRTRAQLGAPHPVSANPQVLSLMADLHQSLPPHVDPVQWVADAYGVEVPEPPARTSAVF